MDDSLWRVIILTMLMPIPDFNDNRLNYLNKYKKYGDENDV